MSLQHTLMPATLAAMALALAGCSTTPGWDAQFGSTVRQARAVQTIDAAASSRASAPEGLDGKAAAGSLRDYADGFDYVERGPRPEQRVRVNPR
jgi:hypothetical protein